MGNQSCFDPVRKPPASLDRVVAQLEASTNIRRSGFILPTDIDGICEAADKSFYKAFAHRRGVQKFMLDHGVLLKEGNKFYFDADRAAELVDACLVRRAPARAIPVQTRLRELKTAKTVVAKTSEPILEPTPLPITIPAPAPKIKEEKVLVPLDSVPPPAQPDPEVLVKPCKPVVLKYVLFLTPVEMDVWITLCALAREALDVETRVAIADDCHQFFLECASANLKDCTPEQYADVVNRFELMGIITHVIGKVIEGKRAYRFLVDWEQFHCVFIQERGPTEESYSYEYNLNGQTLNIWKGFEEFTLVKKSQPTLTGLTSIAQPAKTFSGQMHRVSCDARSAKVLLQIANGTYQGGLQKNKEIPFSLVHYLDQIGFLENLGGGKHPIWVIDRDRAFLTRFQLCVSRDVGVRGKFKQVTEQIPEDHDQWRKDLEEIAAHDPSKRSAPTPVARASVAEEPKEKTVSLPTLPEMPLDELKALEESQCQMLDLANTALRSAQHELERWQRESLRAQTEVDLRAFELSQTRDEIKNRKRKAREVIERELEAERARVRELEQQLAALGD